MTPSWPANPLLYEINTRVIRAGDEILRYVANLK